MAVITTEEIRLVVSGDKAALTALKAFSDAQGDVGKSSKKAGASLEEMEAAMKASGGSAKKTQQTAAAYRDTLRSLERAAKRTSGSFEQISRESLRVASDHDRAAKSAGGLGGAFGGLNKKVKALAVSLAAMVSVGAAVGEFSKAVSLSSDFGRSVANVDTLLQAGGVSIERYRAQLLDLSTESSKGLLDLSAGLYQTISAGIPAVEGAAGAFEVLKAAQKAAVAGLATTEEGVNATVTILNAYGTSTITAQEATDKLLRTVNLGRTTFPELANSLGMVATTAAKFGVNVDELLASVAAMTRAGLGTEEAITSIQATILGLSSPAQNVSKLAKQLGLDFSASGIQANGFAGTLEKLQQVTGGNADLMAQLFPNVRALRGVMVLAGKGAQGLGKDMEALQSATGATDKAAEKISKTFDNTAKIFKSQVEATYIAAAEKSLPRLREVLERVGAYMVENQEEIARAVKDFVEGVIRVGEFVVRHGDTMITFVESFFAAALIGKAATALRAVKTELVAISAASMKMGGYGAAAGTKYVGGFSTAMSGLKGVISTAMKSPLLAATGFTVGWEIGEQIGLGIKSWLHDEDHWNNVIAIEEALQKARMQEFLDDTGFKTFEDAQASAAAIRKGEAFSIDGKAMLPSEVVQLGSGMLEQGSEEATNRFNNKIQDLNERLQQSREAFQKSAEAAELWKQRFAELDAEFRGSVVAQLDGDFAKQRAEAQKNLNSSLKDSARLQAEALRIEGKIIEALDAQKHLRSLVAAQERNLAEQRALQAADEAAAARAAQDERNAEYRTWFKRLKKQRTEEERDRRRRVRAWKARQSRIKAELRELEAFQRRYGDRGNSLFNMFAPALDASIGQMTRDEINRQERQQARWRLEAEAVNAQIAAQQQARAQQLQQAQGVGLIGGGLLLEGGTIDAQGTQQLDEFKRTMEAATDTSIMAAQTIEGAFRGMADSLGEAVAVAIIHGERLDRVFKKGAASMIESLSIQAFQQAAYLIAALPAASILFPGVGTGAVLTAAGSLAAFGVGAAGIAALLGGGNRGRGGVGRGAAGAAGAGFSAPQAARAPESNAQGGNTTIVLRLGFSRSETHDAVFDEANSRLGLTGRPRIQIAPL